MIRRRSAFGLFFIAVAVVLGLAMVVGAFQILPALAQTVPTPTVTIATDQSVVHEGGEASFTLNVRRWAESPLDPLTVRVRTWEPNQRSPDDTNPSEQIHTVTFPAVPFTDPSASFLDQRKTVTVTVTDDREPEVSDFLRAEVLEDFARAIGSVDHVEIRIEDGEAIGIRPSDTALETEEGAPDVEPGGVGPVTIMGITGTELPPGKATPAPTGQARSIPPAVTVRTGQNGDAAGDGLSGSGRVGNQDDSRYVTVDPTNHVIVEGGSARYQILLHGERTEDVIVEARVLSIIATHTVRDSEEGVWFDWPFYLDTNTDDDRYTITHTLTGNNYDEVSVASVTVNVEDKDPVMGYKLVRVGPVDEDAGTMRVEVRAVTQESGEPTIDYAIRLRSIDGTAKSGIDFEGMDETLWFRADDFEEFEPTQISSRYRQTMFVDIPIIDDEIEEDTESFRLKLQEVLGYHTPVFLADEIDVTIKDDEPPSVEVSFEQAGYNVAESDDGSTVDVQENKVTVTVTLSKDPKRRVNIPISRMNQGGASDSDYSRVPPLVIFNSGDQVLTFTFTATDDAVDDDGESVELSFGSPLPDGVSAGIISEATVSITDDDTARVTVTPLELTIEEGNQDTYNVVLNTEPAGDVTVTIGGLTGTEVTLDQGILTFDEQNWNQRQTVTVTAGHDADLAEDTITLRHTVTSVDDGNYHGLSAGSVIVTVTDDDTAGVTVTPTVLEIGEGSQDTYNVVLNAEPAGDVTVTIGGTTGTDLTLDQDILTFDEQNWNQRQTVTVTAGHDSDVNHENITLTHTVTSVDDGNYHGLSAGSVTVTVTDDDIVAVAVSFDQDTHMAPEGGSARIRVTLSEDPKRRVIIWLTRANQGGATADDYQVLVGLDFRSGETQKTFSFLAVQDDVDDDGESVKLSFSSPLPEGVFAGTINETVVSIIDDDDPRVEVSFEHAWYSVLEGGSVAVTVTLSADPERTVIVPLTARNQMGATSDDYSPVPDSLTFYGGETEKSFTFTAIEDEVDDDWEKVRLEFGPTLPARVSAGTPDYAEVLITGERTTHIQKVKPNGTADYSTTVSGRFLVRIHFLPSASELLEEDLEVTGGTVLDILARPRDSLNVWYVSILVDDILPGEEAPTVTVRVPEDVVEGGNPAAEVTYDVLPALTALLTTDATEPVTGNFQATVTFSEDVTEFPGGTEGSAVWYFSPSEDLAITNGTFVSYRKVTDRVYEITVMPDFGPGLTTTTITLPYGKVATGFNTDIWNLEANLLEVQAGRWTLDFEQAAYTVDEGADVTVTVTMDADPLTAVEIPLVITDQNGAEAGDYSGIPISLTFSAGDIVKTFTFSATDDSIDDDGESVRIGIGTPLPNGIKRGNPSRAIVTITDNDEPGVSISKASLDIEEGDSASYEVELDTEPAGDVTVTIGGTTGTDLSLDPASLTFTDQNWNQPQTVTVTAGEDADKVDEAPATLRHTVSSLDDGAYNGLSADDVTVTITDDDEPGVSISETSLEIEEGDSASYEVELDTEPAGDVTVTIGGTTGTDLSLDQASLTFTDQNWSVPQRVTVTADHDSDAVDEAPATITHTVSSLDDGAYDGLDADDVTVSITDDDEPGVSISETSLEIEEGNSDTYEVQLDTEPAGDVTVTVGGTTGTDLSLDPASLTFTEQNWNVPQRVTVTAGEDSDAANEAQVTITHTVRSPGDGA